MTTKDDGGPAFPTGTQVEQNHATGETVVHQYLSDGISVRDYFAATAMPSVIKHTVEELAGDGECWGLSDSDKDGAPSGVAEMIAEDCYAMADAMLKARNA